MTGAVPAGSTRADDRWCSLKSKDVAPLGVFVSVDIPSGETFLEHPQVWILRNAGVQIVISSRRRAAEKCEHDRDDTKCTGLARCAGGTR